MVSPQLASQTQSVAEPPFPSSLFGTLEAGPFASFQSHWAPGPIPLFSKFTDSSCRPWSPGKAVARALAPSWPQGQDSQNPSFIEATDAKDLHNPGTEQFGSKNSVPSGSNDPPHVHEQNSQASSISEITRQTPTNSTNCRLQTPHADSAEDESSETQPSVTMGLWSVLS